MQIKKILPSFGHFVLMVKQQIRNNKTEQNDIYRIVEIKKSANRQTKLVIQIRGKLSVIECSPDEIIADDRIFHGFSKFDIRLITYLACEQLKKPKYKLVIQDFCDQFSKMVFKLKEIKTETFIVKTAKQIVTDKNLVNNLSSEDISSISYVAGYESTYVD